MFDVVFISYQETNAEQNWQVLKSKIPSARRLHGITGLHRAHVIAAHMVTTDMFYCVDGDALLMEDFNFRYDVTSDKMDHVHVFRAKNPINDLVYGYGAVKLLPTQDVKRLVDSDFKTDMTTSINRRYHVVNILSNITAFDTDAFNTWRSAFRECAKLASKIIPDQIDEETDQRLHAWCNVGADRQFGWHCISGAIAGREYGRKHGRDLQAMSAINDMEWMRKRFEAHDA